MCQQSKILSNLQSTTMKIHYFIWQVLFPGLLLTPLILFPQDKMFPDTLKALYLQGKFQNVVTWLPTTLQNDSTNASLYYLGGMAWRNLLNEREALSYFYKAVALDSSNTQFLFALGRSYYILDRFAEAAALFRKILRIDSTHYGARLWQAETEFARQHYREAERLYCNLLLRDSQNAHLHRRLAICVLKTGNTARAIHYFRQALVLNPYDLESALTLAKFLLRKSKQDSAFLIIEQTLSYHPSSMPLLKIRANILFQKKLYRAAAHNFHRLVALGDSSAPTLRRLGVCLLYSDSLTAAQTILTRALQRDSTDALTHFYLGIALKESKHYSKAVRHLKQGIQLAIPNFLADFYTQLGSALESQLNYPDAIQSYRNALRYDPSRTIIYFYLASLYENYYADKRVALWYYRKFLQVDRNSEASFRDYAQLRLKKLIQTLHFINGKN